MVKKKRLFIVTCLDQGGLETYLLRFLKYDNHQHYNLVLCKSGLSGELEGEFMKAADEILLFPLGFFSIVDYIRFYHFLKGNKIDVICDFTGNFAGFPLWVAKIAKIEKRITFYRGSTNHFKETFLKKLYNSIVNKLVFSFSTRILSNSEAAFSNLFSHVQRDSRFKVIYNGVDMSSFHQCSQESLKNEFGFKDMDFIIGHTGRCNEAKNHDTIMAVAEVLCKRYENIHFVLLGKGVAEKYSEFIRLKGLGKQIHCFGYRDDVLRLLPLFDVFYFPSVTEGQPNALIEAMLTGLPILTSDIPPIKETVPDCMYPLLLSPCDVEQAVKTLENLYQGTVEISAYQCRDWARERFDANKLFAEFQQEL